MVKGRTPAGYVEKYRTACVFAVLGIVTFLLVGGRIQKRSQHVCYPFA